jgi:hypothetical protein
MRLIPSDDTRRQCRRYRLARVLTISLLLALAVRPAIAKALPIWFNPLTWNIKPSGHGLEYAEHDFPAMVASDARWKVAAGRVAVMELPGNVITSYLDAPSLVAFAGSHHWKLALSVGVEFNGGKCERSLEGMSKDMDANREAIRIVQRWKQLGGKLDFLVMDSPLFFAHYAAQDCHFSIQEAADRAAATIRGVLAEFPDVKLVDAEGPGPIADNVWLADMATWFAAFRAASGRPIDMVVLDLHWIDPWPNNNWQTTARRAIASFRDADIATGLLINAQRREGMTDAQWMDENRQHIQETAASDLDLEFIAIDQWHHHVRFNLPESDTSAYTSLVNDAFDAMRHRQPD